MSDYAIAVEVRTHYMEDQSVPEENRYVFTYTINIRNTGQLSAQLLSRYWLITDGNEEVQEVQGMGVVGEQPLIAPGESYEYTSGCVLATAVGSMRGHYLFQAEDDHEFQAEIPAFTLARPHALH